MAERAHVLCLLCVWISLATASASAVVDLGTSLSAWDAAAGRHDVTLVILYAPWCGTSQLVLHQVQLAAAHSGLPEDTGFYSVDCWTAGECAQTSRPAVYPQAWLHLRHGAAKFALTGSTKHWQIVSFLRDLANPVTFAATLGEGFHALRSDGVTVLVYCREGTTGPTPACAAPSPAYRSPSSASLSAASALSYALPPAMECDTLRAAGRHAIADLQHPYQRDLVVVGISSAAVAARLGLHADRALPLASHALPGGLQLAPLHFDMSNATNVGTWLAATCRRRRRTPYVRVEDLASELVRATPPFPQLEGPEAAFAVGPLPSPPLGPVLAGLFLPERAALNNATVRAACDRVVADLRLFVRRARSSAERRKVNAAVIDADAVPDMLLRAGLPQRTGADPTAALVLYLPQERATFALSLEDSGTTDVASFAHLSWSQSVTAAPLSSARIEPFLEAVIALPRLNLSTAAVIADLRTQAALVDPVPDSALTLILLSHSTCAACQALLPAWHALDRQLGDMGNGVQCKQAHSARDGAATGIPVGCVALRLVDIGSVRLSPVLEHAVRAVPAIVLLAPDGTALIGGSAAAQIDLGAATLRTAGALQWVLAQRRHVLEQAAL